MKLHFRDNLVFFPSRLRDAEVNNVIDMKIAI